VKLASFRQVPNGDPDHAGRLGIVQGDRLVPASALGPGVPGTMVELLQGWPQSLEVLRTAFPAAASDARIAIDDVELLAPVPRPGKIAAAGVNYRSHGDEQNRPPPDQPVLFAKFPSAVIGSGRPIRWSTSLTEAVDFEAELAVVIGRTCRRVNAEQAMAHVAGYTCLNDVSARDLQYADRQFVRAKSLDTFCPMGPWLVTADDIPDPQALRIQCLVNGELMQDASTAEMIFGVAALVSFCSHAFTLEPGDVIATGTPAGVGWFREPKRMLADGDTVEVRIEQIGSLVNPCREERGTVD
jgi:2-keto-4-pentenoate hydratase/2-oxohepta-3-ene-1,7-dioic acid hydratase in catechol pathway